MTMMVTTTLAKRTSMSSQTISSTISLIAKEAANQATLSLRRKRIIMRKMTI